jgi:hypothetical protein
MKKEELSHHLVVGMLVNLAIVLAAGTYLLENPVLRLAAIITVILALATFALVIRGVRHSGKNLRHLGYYFLPTALVLWALNERRRRASAELQAGRLRELKEMIATWPDTTIGIIAGILDPEQQEETLSTLLNKMDKMKDCRLATITDRIRQYCGQILKSVDDHGNYHLFEQVMSRLASLEPKAYRQTYKSLWLLLSDIFDPALSANFGRQFRKDMTGPLKDAIEQAGRTQTGHVQGIVAKIMAAGENEHQIANSVAEMLLQLNWTEKREVCRIIFNEGVKRAIRFPKHFGIDFLIMLSRLEHRVFWLDIESLRNMLEESLNRQPEGLINLNLRLYDELCSKVLAPLENPERGGICNARVFRRLKGNDGKVRIECISSDGKVCSCEGESLSFRGIYSRKCRKNAGEEFAMNIIPIREVKRQFRVKASIAPLHAYESGNQGPGRGAFFQDAEPSAVRGLYEYVSTKK